MGSCGCGLGLSIACDLSPANQSPRCGRQGCADLRVTIQPIGAFKELLEKKKKKKKRVLLFQADKWV
eukprot:1155637-Pelagomonas_calceolata.AAC.1